MKTPDKRGMQFSLLEMMIFMLTAVGAVLVAINLIGGNFRIMANSNQQSLNDNFELLVQEVGKLVASRDGFKSSTMALRLSKPVAIVGFNPVAGFTLWEDGKNQKEIIRPEAFCSASCLCLYYDRGEWGVYSKRNANVWCKDFSDSVIFYSRRDKDDKNIGYPYRTDTTLAESQDYEYFVLTGEKFGTKAMYIEKQEIKGINYVYIAEYDSEEVR